MSGNEPSGDNGARPSRQWTKWLMGVGLGTLLLLYIIVTLIAKPDARPGRGPAGEALNTGPAKASEVAPQALHVISLTSAKGQGASVPDARFVDAAGKSASLADFHGKVVLLNLWATWCAPCRKEMPQLAALQTAYAGKNLVVLALSQDSPKATDKARAFIAENAPLAFYQDTAFAVPPAMTPSTAGFPTSYFIDRTGHIRGVVNGDADWTGPKSRAVIDQLLAE